MQEKLNYFQNEIQQLNEQVEKNKRSYNINRRNDEYQPNLQYENYDEEIIKGESILDCQIENIKRQLKILSIYNEMIEKCNEMKNEIKENSQFMKEFQETVLNFQKEIKEQEKNVEELNKTIENLDKIKELEFKKESKEERKEIEILQYDYKEFEYDIFEYDFFGQKYNLNFLEKNQIKKWTNMKCGNIIFDSNIHKWEIGNSEFDKKILNKRNLLFLIGIEDVIKFGAFIKNKIYHHAYIPEDDPHEVFGTDCENSFLFAFNDNKPIIEDDIEKYWRRGDAFCLWNEEDDELFSFIWMLKIGKKGCRSYFNDKDLEKLFIGEKGDDYVFYPERILVIQMEELSF